MPLGAPLGLFAPELLMLMVIMFVSIMVIMFVSIVIMIIPAAD
jgi:hypothetical protein|tara:strand:- start:204 stop:332 length:129 start_codon:yes stop_codon:yes gene_type:complete